MASLKILLAAAAALLAVSGAAQADDSGDTFRPLYACSERLWPQAPLHELNVVLVNRADRSAAVFQDPGSPASARLPPPTADQIADMLARPVGFFTTTLAGRQALIVSYDGRADAQVIAGVETAYHEGFHLIGQAAWPPTTYERVRQPGANPGLRYARAELARSLMGWLQGRAGAGAARYWWDQARAQAGDEAALMTALDRLEGSAEYVGKLGLALAINGCDASDQALTDFAAQRLQQSWPADSLAHLAASPDAESYVIGASAMLLLRRQQASAWQARVRQGGDPLDLLLAGARPVAQPADDALRHAVEATARALGPSRQAAIAAVVQHYERDGARYVAVPQTWDSTVGFDESGGPATGTTAQHQSLSMVLAATGAAQGRSGRVAFKATDVLVVDAAPCGPGHYGLLPLPEGAAIDPDKPGLHVESPTLTIDVPSAKVGQAVDAQGRRFLCLPPG